MRIFSDSENNYYLFLDFNREIEMQICGVRIEEYLVHPGFSVLERTARILFMCYDVASINI